MAAQPDLAASGSLDSSVEPLVQEATIPESMEDEMAADVKENDEDTTMLYFISRDDLIALPDACV